MQSLNWYAHRLRSMSPAEIGWRVHHAVRNQADRLLAAHRRRPSASTKALEPGATGLAIDGAAIGAHLSSPGTCTARCATEWRRGLTASADEILAGRVRILGGQVTQLSDPIRWNHEYQADVATPMGWSGGIDYRDFRVTGDAKWVWDLNRQQHLVVLARAYSLTGETRYADAVLGHIGSWIAQCPFGYGMNWRSPMELAIRQINWAVALALIAPAGRLDGALAESIAVTSHRHLWEIARKYARYSSANNHTIGEAAGVFIASCLFANLRNRKRHLAQSRALLIQEIERQTFADGGNREMALGYHRFVLEFFLAAGIVGRKTGNDFPAAYWARVEQMLAFLGALTEGGPLPMYGDCDDGYVLNLGGERGDPRSLLAVGAVLFDRADFKAWAGPVAEPVYWWFGDDGIAHYDRLDADAALPPQIAGRAMRESGLYLLQSGERNGADRISITFDCGPLGYQSIAAHGHADALSITLRAYGTDILVDPGTYDYFTYPAYRDYFRSTRAHNTITIDGCNQSEMRGPFMWGRRAECALRAWDPTDVGGRVSAEHNGYAELRDPVIHRRSVSLDGRVGRIRIDDELTCRERHHVEQYWHFAELVEVEQIDAHTVRAHCRGGDVEMIFDRQFTITLATGREDPILGWVSRAYHEKSPATTLVASATLAGHTRYQTYVQVTPLHGPEQADWNATARTVSGAEVR